MFFILSKILEFILSPLIWIVGILIFGFFTKNANHKRKSLGIALISLLFFTNPFLANKVMEVWELPPVNMNTITKPYDIGVLLGGSLRYFDTASERPVYSQSVDRLIQTIALYKAGKIKKIMLSGGSGLLLSPGEKESEILIEVFHQYGIPLSDIILENESRNTRENAIFTAKIINENYSGSNVLLITSAFHMRRSLSCFQKTGLKVTPFSVDKKSSNLLMTPDRTIIPDPSSLMFWDVLLHEWFGFVTYKIAGYI